MSRREFNFHERICRADECSRTIKAAGQAQGLCTVHYQEYLKALLAEQTAVNITRQGPCLAGNCDLPRRSRGLCANHYAYSRRHNTCPSCGEMKKNRSALCEACHRAAVVARDPTEKMCMLCRRILPLDAFRLRKSSQGAAKWRSRCRDCGDAQQRMRAKNAQQSRTTVHAASSYASLRGYAKKLGISWAEVVERYPSDNRCEICKRTPEEAYTADRFARLSLDHCHETGKLRGFLCGPCNAGLGQLGDTVERVRAAVHYLARQTRAGHERRDVDQDPIPGL